MSLSYLPPRMRKAEGRRLGLLSAKRWKPKALSWYDTHMRALHDRKGKVIAEGTSYAEGKEVAWVIRHSLNGRCDQFDVIVNGYLSRTCGRRAIPAHLRPRNFV